MNFPLNSWIAARYLRSRSAGRFAPMLTATAVAGIAAGTMALVVVMSVMLGFRDELAQRLAGFSAHITLIRAAGSEELRERDLDAILEGVRVVDAVPYVQGEVIATAEGGGEPAVLGARVRGVDMERMGAMSGIDIYRAGDGPGLPDTSWRDEDSLPEATVGSEAAAQLMVHPDFADSLRLTAPLAEVGPAGDLVPNSRSYRVAGIFRSGIYEYDGKYVLVGLEEAQRLLGQQAEEGWQIRLADPTDTPEALAAARARLPEGWRAEGFDEHNRKLFAALKLERAAMGAILAMVLVIASCSIAGVALLITAAKRRDIGIMQAIGLSQGRIRRIFITHASLIGAAGSGIGFVLGTLAATAAQMWPIRLPDSYYLDYLPVELNLPLSAAFALVGVAVAAAASFYPVATASRVSPIEVLRYE
ncbi:MAG: ABC transporter permease [Proteobacteria bacterium]|nr:ABC transporter permease [Pseudomonadota bacterium]